MKLIGNSDYGLLTMDVEKHQNVKYLKGKHKASLKTKSPFFKKLSNLDSDIFEILIAKNKIRLALPIYLGYHILRLAKLKMLSFYHDCVSPRKCCDTHIAYDRRQPGLCKV